VFGPGTAGIFAAISFYLIDKTGAGINPIRVFTQCLVTGKFSLFGYYFLG